MIVSKTDGPIAIDVTKLNAARSMPIDAAVIEAAGPCRPWLVVALPSENGKKLRLIDFASAGATGKEYQSWLPASTHDRLGRLPCFPPTARC